MSWFGNLFGPRPEKKKKVSGVALVTDAYSKDAVDHARKVRNIVLDFSEGSIDRLEQVLEELHQTVPKDDTGNVPASFEATLVKMSKIYGSYLGVAIQRSFGGEWTSEGSIRDAALWMLTVDGLQMWPYRRVYQRIVHGTENNVVHYFQYVRDHGKPPAADGS